MVMGTIMPLFIVVTNAPVSATTSSQSFCSHVSFLHLLRSFRSLYCLKNKKKNGSYKWIVPYITFYACINIIIGDILNRLSRTNSFLRYHSTYLSSSYKHLIEIYRVFNLSYSIKFAYFPVLDKHCVCKHFYV